MANAADQTRADGPAGRPPDGIWKVDPRQGEVGFAVKGMWGLVTVRGRFTAYTGALEVGAAGSVGKLTIDAASIDTGNARRDTHLRTADFFDVERHPQIVFDLTAPSAPDDRPAVVGELAIGSSRRRLEIPVAVERSDDDELLLAGETTISRTAVGVTWNLLGTVGDDVTVKARLVLERQIR